MPQCALSGPKSNDTGSSSEAISPHPRAACRCRDRLLGRSALVNELLTLLDHSMCGGWATSRHYPCTGPVGGGTERPWPLTCRLFPVSSRCRHPLWSTMRLGALALFESGTLISRHDE